jgi:ATP-dependent Clp protease ATP-binding subunit ClpA
VLRKTGLTQDGVRNYLREHPPAGEQMTRKRGVVVGASASGAIERAESQAMSTKSEYVGTEHVLLALLDEQGGAASGILDAYKSDRATMRQSLVQMLVSHVVIQWPSFEPEK